MTKKVRSGGAATINPGDYIAVPRWSKEELLAVKHLGPAIIGEDMYEASQALVSETNGGVFGPALLGIVPDAYKDQRTLKDA